MRTSTGTTTTIKSSLSSVILVFLFLIQPWSLFSQPIIPNSSTKTHNCCFNIYPTTTTTPIKGIFFRRHYHEIINKSRRRRHVPLVVVVSAAALSNDAEQILSLIETRYETPPPPPTLHQNRDRIRKYLYRAKSLDVETATQVMNYLEQVFPDDDDILRTILYTSPRILRKNAQSQLKPTVHFLKNLYGPSMFFEAIRRNPNLLLTSGIGYNLKHHNSGTNNAAYYLQHELGLSQSVIRKIEQSSPYVFQLSVDKSIRPVVMLLSSVLRSSSHQTKKTTKDSNSTDNDDEIDDDDDDRNVKQTIRKIVLNHPSIFHLKVDDNLYPKIKYLQTICGNDIVSNVIRSCPGILGLSLDYNLQPTVDFLLYEMDLVDDNNNQEEEYTNLRRCLRRHPQILALSFDNLSQKVNYFHDIDRLSSSSSEKGEESSIANDRQTNNKRRRNSLAHRIAIVAPSTYSLSLKENIIPTVECLGRMWGVSIPARPYFDDVLSDDDESQHKHDDGFSSQQTDQNDKRQHRSLQKINNEYYSLSKLLYEYPQILTLSLEGNIQPTIRFFQKTGYLPSNEDNDNDIVVQRTQQQQQTPKQTTKTKTLVRARHLATSLFHRLLPRWHYLTEIHESSSLKSLFDESNSNSKELPPLHILASATDASFCHHFDIDLRDYDDYKRTAMPRLKFSSQFDTWLKTGRSIDGVSIE